MLIRLADESEAARYPEYRLEDYAELAAAGKRV
jgi:hypothetical protein